MVSTLTNLDMNDFMHAVLVLYVLNRKYEKQTIILLEAQLIRMIFQLLNLPLTLNSCPIIRDLFISTIQCDRKTQKVGESSELT